MLRNLLLQICSLDGSPDLLIGMRIKWINVVPEIFRSSKTARILSRPDCALEEYGVLGDNSYCRSQVRQPYLADVHLQILVQSIQWLKSIILNYIVNDY